MKKILPDALAAIKPTKKELETELAFAERLRAYLQKKVPRGCEVVLTGSIAKRTFLRDKRDVDIFVLFNRSAKKSELEGVVRRIMEKAFPGLGYQVSYAEHPYVRFHFEGRRIDLVPAYKISDASERLSAVDRSVLHTKFVMKSLGRNQRDDVLLLKQFLRANSIYGAEIKIHGFSGYLCELLIITYGSFVNLAKAAAKWKPPVFLDLLGVYKKKEEIKKAKESFGSFVVIDPTDRNRNVAAAVSKENLANFISLCRSFMKKPSREFFFRKPENFSDRLAKAAKGRKTFVLSMPRPDIVDDVLWGQIWKMTGQLKEHLKDFGPSEILADDSRHLVRLGIALRKDKLSPTVMLEGPPISMPKHAEHFRRTHKKARFSIRKKKIFAEVKRQLVKAEDAIMGFFAVYAQTKSHLAYPEEMLVLEKGNTRP